jgi:hypothetical protein
MHGLPIDRIAVYESPYVIDDNGPAPAQNNLERLGRMLHAGDHDGAAALFLQENVGMSPEGVTMMRATEAWGFMVQQAPAA